jgi:hypothetical protein
MNIDLTTILVIAGAIIVGVVVSRFVRARSSASVGIPETPPARHPPPARGPSGGPDITSSYDPTIDKVIFSADSERGEQFLGGPQPLQKSPAEAKELSDRAKLAGLNIRSM